MLKDLLVTTLHRAITSPVGDRFAPVRVPRSLARRLNVTLGQPLCSAEELATRRAADARLGALRERRGEGGSPSQGAPAPADAPVAAPVMVYFEKDRGLRERSRIEELLRAKSIDYQLLDLTGDEATMAFVTRTAGCKDDDLPVVFVAGAPIGGYAALVEADVSGTLAKAVHG